MGPPIPVALGQEDHKDPQGDLPSAHPLQEGRTILEENTPSLHAPLQASQDPPQDPEVQQKNLPVDLGQEDQKSWQENVQASYPHEKEGQKVGEDQTIIHAIGWWTPSCPKISQEISVALGQEDQEGEEGQEDQVVPQTYPFQAVRWQVETHPPSLLAPGPQKQDLQMEVG